MDRHNESVAIAPKVENHEAYHIVGIGETGP
jgi:hypothetical protein